MSRQFNIFSLSPVVKSLVEPIFTSSLVLGSLLWCSLLWCSFFPGHAWASSLQSYDNVGKQPPIDLVAVLDTVDISAVNQDSDGNSGPYKYRDRPSSDGIGKFYMGREIAEVMGHRGAAWLERPSRIQEEKPHVLMANLDIELTDVIADIGAGTGYLTVRLAPKVPQGKVLSVDVQLEMLEMLGNRIDPSSPEGGFDNVELILASDDDPHLPSETVDMAIMLDVYHELEYPCEVMQQVVRSLRPGGKMVLVEYRGENPLVPIKRLHKMTEKQVRKEMNAVGLTWVETNEELPRQHLIIFEKA